MDLMAIKKLILQQNNDYIHTQTKAEESLYIPYYYSQPMSSILETDQLIYTNKMQTEPFSKTEKDNTEKKNDNLNYK